MASFIHLSIYQNLREISNCAFFLRNLLEVQNLVLTLILNTIHVLKWRFVTLVYYSSIDPLHFLNFLRTRFGHLVKALLIEFSHIVKVVLSSCFVDAYLSDGLKQHGLTIYSYICSIRIELTIFTLSYTIHLHEILVFASKGDDMRNELYLIL